MAISPNKRKRVYERDGYKCRYCGKDGKLTGDISIDHIIPRCKGGSDDDDNLATACYECNNVIKNAKPLEECGLELIKI